MSDTPITHTGRRLNQQMQGHIHIYFLTRIYMDMPLYLSGTRQRLSL